MSYWILEIIELLKRDQSVILSLEDVLEKQTSKSFSPAVFEVVEAE